MSKIKYAFNRFRVLVSSLFFFICIFIIISFNMESFSLATKIVMVLVSTGLFLVVSMLLKSNKK